MSSKYLRGVCPKCGHDGWHVKYYDGMLCEKCKRVNRRDDIAESKIVRGSEPRNKELGL